MPPAKRKTTAKRKMPAKKKAYRPKTVPRYPAVLRSTTGERKSIDTLDVNYALNLTGAVALLNGVFEGAAYYNRIGRKIEMKSLQLKGWLEPIATASQAVPATGRILIVYDRQPNGATPVYSDVIKSLVQTNTGGTVVTSSTTKDFVNLDNRDRFQILRDIEFIMPSVTRAGSVDTFVQGTSVHGNGAGDEFQFNEFIKLKGLVAHYKGATAGIGDIATGSLLLLTISSLTAGNEGWLASLNFRLRYNDT